MEATTGELRVAERRRDYVSVSGPDSADYLERMLSNSVVSLAEGDSCEALLLTPRARVIAPLRVLRRASEDFLLLTELGLGEEVRGHLLRSRFAAKAEIELEDHRSLILLGSGLRESASTSAVAVSNGDYGLPGIELLDAEPPAGATPISAAELEELRIRAGTPRFGSEIDDRVLPAEAGLVERAVSFDKGCYPGQEPVARLQHRGHANRELRRLVIDSVHVPAGDTPIVFDGKDVGRVTSAVRTEDGVIALGYVRREVPVDALLEVGSARARSLD